MPWVFGFLVIWTYVLQKAIIRILPLLPGLYQHPSMPLAQGVHEVREHGYTFALMLSTVYYFALKRHATITGAEAATAPNPVHSGR
jgi:hypothetical protein